MGVIAGLSVCACVCVCVCVRACVRAGQFAIIAGLSVAFEYFLVPETRRERGLGQARERTQTGERGLGQARERTRTGQVEDSDKRKQWLGQTRAVTRIGMNNDSDRRAR